MSDISFSEIMQGAFSEYVHIEDTDNYFGCICLDQRISDRWYLEPVYKEISQEQLEQILNKLKELNGDVK